MPFVSQQYPTMHASPQVVMENLFALYPPAAPTAEERTLEQQQKVAAAAKLVRLTQAVEAWPHPGLAVYGLNMSSGL